MKKILFFTAMFFCFLIVAYKTFFYIDASAEKKAITQHIHTSRLTAHEMSLIKEGDFILRRGFGIFSDYIANTLNNGPIDVTHAGIIVINNGVPYVIHSLSSDVSVTDGVQIQPLSEFLSHSAPDKIIITRLKGTDAAMGSTIADKAKDYLDKNIPFDHSGNYDDDSELYCTELIWKILEKDLKQIKLPAKPDARKAFFHSMTPLYDKKYFDITINQYTN